MRAIPLFLSLVIIITGCNAQPTQPRQIGRGVFKVESCSDEEGYAVSKIQLLNDDRFAEKYTCQFPAGTTCFHVQNAKKVDIVGVNKTFIECKIVK